MGKHSKEKQAWMGGKHSAKTCLLRRERDLGGVTLAGTAQGRKARCRNVRMGKRSRMNRLSMGKCAQGKKAKKVGAVALEGGTLGGRTTLEANRRDGKPLGQNMLGGDGTKLKIGLDGAALNEVAGTLGGTGWMGNAHRHKMGRSTERKNSGWFSG